MLRRCSPLFKCQVLPHDSDNSDRMDGMLPPDGASSWASGAAFRPGRPKAGDAAPSELPRWCYRPPDWVPVGIRNSASLDAAVVAGEYLQPGEVFAVAQVEEGPKQQDGSVVTFLKLWDGRGWVFDRKPDCGVLCVPFREEDAEVMLSTYRLQLPCDCLLNCVKRFCMADADAYHVGVTVYGREWAFYGGCDLKEGHDATGVRYLPQGAWSPSICRITPLGPTPLTELEANAAIQRLEDEWPSRGYRFLTRNCCHFAQEMCSRLEVGPIPDRILRLDLYASSEVMAIVHDGKELRGRSRTDTFYASDFCCGLAAYGRKARGRGLKGTSCYSFIKQPYYWVRGVAAFLSRVRSKDSQKPFGPAITRSYTVNH